MKAYTIILTALLVPMLSFASCGSQTSNKPLTTYKRIQPDSSVQKILGDTITNLLFNPKKITVYSLSNREPDKSRKEIEVCPNFVRDSLLTVLQPDLCAILQFNLLADSVNYKNDIDRVKSPYRPLLEFEFTCKKESASVLISLSDYTWAIMYKSKEICRFNYANKQLLFRFKQLILNK